MEALFKGFHREDLKEYLDLARLILAASGDGLPAFSFRKWAVDTISIVLKRGAGLPAKEKQTNQQGDKNSLFYGKGIEGRGYRFKSNSTARYSGWHLRVEMGTWTW